MSATATKTPPATKPSTAAPGSPDRMAMIEADLLVKDVLFRIGYPGKDLAEQLESPKADVFSDIDAMKEADRLYRQIVRDPKIPLDYQTAKTAILSFEQGLKDARAFRNK